MCVRPYGEVACPRKATARVRVTLQIGDRSGPCNYSNNKTLRTLWTRTQGTHYRYVTEADAKFSGLAVMGRCREMVHTDGPVLDDDLSVGTGEYNLGQLGGGGEDYVGEG